MRHGEVHNPAHVLYGRLPNFALSPAGRRMAREAADYVQRLSRPVAALIASPLQRTRESAEPFTEAFGIEPTLDERVIEPTNVFEGKRMGAAMADPRNWRYLSQPAVPGWGEPYVHVVARMRDAMADAWQAVPSGDVVIVSHQLPIWVTHLAVAGRPLRHDPRRRRCGLSSITSFEGGPDAWREVSYVEPAFTAGALDVGAV